MNEIKITDIIRNLSGSLYYRDNTPGIRSATLELLPDQMIRFSAEMKEEMKDSGLIRINPSNNNLEVNYYLDSPIDKDSNKLRVIESDRFAFYKNKIE